MINAINENFGTFLTYFNCVMSQALFVVTVVMIGLHFTKKSFIKKICQNMYYTYDGNVTGIATLRSVGICHYRIYAYLKLIVTANSLSKEIILIPDENWKKVIDAIHYYNNISPKALSIVPILGKPKDFRIIENNSKITVDPICEIWDDFNLFNDFYNSNRHLHNVLLGIMHEVSVLYSDLGERPNFTRILNHPYLVLDERAYNDYIHAKPVYHVEIPYTKTYYYAKEKDYIKEYTAALQDMQYIADKKMYKVFHQTSTMLGFVKNEDVEDPDCPFPDVFYIEYKALLRIVANMKYDEEYNYKTFIFEELASQTEEIPVMMILDY